MELHQTDTVLFAALTREDLSAYRLTFDALRADSGRTTRLLREILRTARRTLRFSPPEKGRLQVDVLPQKDGGCLVLFTVRKSRLRVVAAPPALLFTTNDTDAFLDLFCLLRHTRPFAAHTALYRTHAGFAGLFSFPNAEEARRGARLLSEFGAVRAAGRETRRHLNEHARAIRFDFLTAAPRPQAL